MKALTQVVEGIHLPLHDTHFPAALHGAPKFEGRATYQLHKLEAGVKLCKQKRVAIDIGAHVGLWSRVLASQFEHVIAYEPLPEHADCFRLNTDGLVNVTLVDWCMLGAEKGYAGIVAVSNNSGNTRVAVDGDPVFLAGNVEPLDDVLVNEVIKKIDFIKIDVEGYELAVVQGAERTIRAAKPVMVVEQKPGYAERYKFRTGEVIDLLKSWGAKPVWLKSGDHCLTW